MIRMLKGKQSCGCNIAGRTSTDGLWWQGPLQDTATLDSRSQHLLEIQMVRRKERLSTNMIPMGKVRNIPIVFRL
jgi:hypothetical protein